jgi:hypothetical protein
MVIAGARVLPVVPVKKSHTAIAMQMSPTISLSFLNSYSPGLLLLYTISFEAVQWWRGISICAIHVFPEVEPG